MILLYTQYSANIISHVFLNHHKQLRLIFHKIIHQISVVHILYTIAAIILQGILLLLSSSGYGFSIIQITPPSPVYFWDITGTLKTAVDRLHALVPYFRTKVYKETVLLMIGGGSPPALKAVQNRIISSGKVSYSTSADHDITRVNVAAGRGVSLAPGFLNDHSGPFA